MIGRFNRNMITAINKHGSGKLAHSMSIENKNKTDMTKTIWG
jgi:hypothetical protein